MFEIVFYFIENAKDVLNLAATCQNAWDAFKGLPAWMPHFLKKSEVLYGVVVPSVPRSLRIIITTRCELCGQTRGKGKTMNKTFRVYAHDACLMQHLIPEPNIDDPRVRGLAVDCSIPFETRFPDKSSLNTTRHFWNKPLEGIIEPCETIQGLALLSDPEAKAETARAAAQRKAIDAALVARTKAKSTREGARRERELREKREQYDRKTQCQQQRRARLEAALAAEGLPSLESLEAQHGHVVLSREEFIAAYLSHRVTDPYPLREAMTRVRAMLAYIAVEEEKKARAARLDDALVKAGLEKPGRRRQLWSFSALERQALDVDELISLVESGDINKPLTDEHLARGIDALKAYRAEVEEKRKREQRMDDALRAAGKRSYYFLNAVEREQVNAEGLEALLSCGDPSNPLTDEAIAAGVARLKALHVRLAEEERQRKQREEDEKAARAARVDAALQARGLSARGDLPPELREYLMTFSTMNKLTTIFSGQELTDSEINEAVDKVVKFNELIEKRMADLAVALAAAGGKTPPTRDSVRDSCLCDKIYTTNHQARVSPLAIKKYLQGAKQYTITCSSCGDLGAQLCKNELCVHCCHASDCLRHVGGAFTYIHNKTWNSGERRGYGYGFGFGYGRGYGFFGGYDDYSDYSDEYDEYGDYLDEDDLYW